MKIALLGAAGGIGQALALLLKLQLPAHTTLALYDIAPMIAGVALDLSHIPTAVTVTGYGGGEITAALQYTDIVIITAGVARKPGMERTDLLAVNAKIIGSLIQEIAITAPHAWIAIITNPINTIVTIAAEILKRAQVYDRNRLFGVTALDAIRANTLVAELTGQPPETITVPVIGGHSGTTILPLFSQVRSASFTEQQIISLTQRLQTAGTEVVNAKAGDGSATLAMAHAGACFTLSLVRALQGESAVEIYAYVESDGPYSRFFVQPLLLSTTGIAKRCDIGPLSPFEQQALKSMLVTLQSEISLGEKLAHDYCS